MPLTSGSRLPCSATVWDIWPNSLASRASTSRTSATRSRDLLAGRFSRAGAENRVKASDQHLRDRPTVRPRMIACCGLATRLPDTRPHAGLAGPSRPIRHGQGRRDPGAPSRGRRTAPTQPAPDLDLRRPRRPQCTGQAATHAATSVTARHAEDPAALARPTRRPTLDLPETPPRPPAHSTADPGAGATDGGREPQLGLPTHPRRAPSDSATSSPPPPCGQS